MIASIRVGTLAAIVTYGLVAPLAAQTNAGDDTPLARIGDRTFSAREVDERWRTDAPFEQIRLLQAVYDGRRAALDALLADYLLERAAAARGVSRERFESDEVGRRVRPVTEQQIAAFYTENRDQVEGRSLQEMTPILRDFLEERRRATAVGELVADLKRAEGAIDLLESPRVPIDLSEDDPSDGPADAPVTVVTFADFQCPYCRELAPTLRRLRAGYQGRLRVVWKDFPLPSLHPQAIQAAEAGQCAREQGRFWEYHDKLFANQPRLRTESLKEYARDVGLDVARFDACLDSSKYKAKVGDAIGAASRLGLRSTPTVFVNGRMVTGVRPYDVLASMVDEELRSRVGP